MGDGWTHGLSGEEKEEEGEACLAGGIFFPGGYSIEFHVVVRWPAGLLATWPRCLLYRWFALACLVDPIPVHLILYLGP